MKRHSLSSGRFALTGIAAATLIAIAPPAWALGLGKLAVQSALGETLHAEIDVTSLSAEESANLQVRIAPPESYRAAGIDYNPVLPGTRAALQRRPDGRIFLSLTSDRSVQEPFVDVILEISWSTGRLVREYTLLFDPPTTRTQAAAPPATSPVITPAPSPAPMAVPAPTPAPAPVAAAPAPAAPAVPPAPPAPRPAPVAPPAPKPAPVAIESPGASQYQVRAGDTLSRIAAKTQPAGISLDQMLVSLYRSNPQAFMDNNMNRLKAGVVLSVPSAETAGAIGTAEARSVIQAQSADFGAYRQRLAGAVPAAPAETNARQSAGKVEAAVEDRKPAPTAPDKLTLSKGAVAGASSAEAQISKAREQRDANARVAELAKTNEQLKQLSSAASAAQAPAAPAPAPAPSPAPAPAPVPAPTQVASAPPAPAPEASAPATLPAVPAPTPPIASASVPASAASAVRPKAPMPPASVPQPGFFTSLIDESPLALAAGAAALVLLAGFAAFRFGRRNRKDSSETSFLESRLQPDSFFGASGGQRIDTRDAAAPSSSMSYSLSQLDAIGDVDPVAEADVYLAYGRDLQAEEILKEAMRANPQRLAIRSKLLEVYAKRRDTKGFELLAIQLYGLTRGEGEEWSKAQELGEQIDPENPLYQPGGAPAGGLPATDARGEPLGASTLPQSVLPTAAATTLPPGERDLDLDLDLDFAPDSMSGAPSRPTPLTTTEVLPVRDDPRDARPSAFDADIDLPLIDDPRTPPAAPAVPDANAPMDFDLSDIALDFDAPAPPPRDSGAAPLPDLSLPEGDSDFGGDDPLARKLELADEFRQIGDVEGARDLLQEVVARASGSLKAKAQAMLDDLS